METNADVRLGGWRYRKALVARVGYRALRRLQVRLGHKRLLAPPATINIELTGRCNVKPPCTFCVGKNQPGYREPDHVRDFERHWPALLRAERVNDCSYGEPLLHPEFEAVVGRLTAAGVTFGFTTNGLLLGESRARFLAERSAHLDMCVSFNAATAETYRQHHGRDFATVVANVERFVALHEQLRPRAKMPLVLSFIVMRSNEHEVFDFLRLADRLGARAVLLRHLFDVRMDYAVDNFGLAFSYERERLPIERYRAIEAEVRRGFASARPPGGRRPPLELYYVWNAQDAFIAEQSEPGVDIPCLFPWKFMSIRPVSGTFQPCVYLKRQHVGTLDQPLAEVWNGEILRGMRRELVAGKVPRFCQEHGDPCPLVIAQREAASAGPAAPRSSR